MSKDNIQLELRQVLGALLFGAKHPVKPSEMRSVLARVAENHTASAGAFGKVKDSDILSALEQLDVDLVTSHAGFHLFEVAGGFRFQTDEECAPWLREFLDVQKPHRLSIPALETLAVIAYRQPVSRSEIEAVRGVNVDSIVRHLLEMQLIRIVGRSSLPGRPMLYGTTQLFLEHFGLNNLDNLPGVDQLRSKQQRHKKKGKEASEESVSGRKPKIDEQELTNDEQQEEGAKS